MPPGQTEQTVHSGVDLDQARRLREPVETSDGEQRITGTEEHPFGFLAQVCEDWRCNGRDWTRPGFRALAVHRFGVWRMSLKPRIVRMPFSFLYNRLYRYVRNHYSIELYYTVTVGRRVVIGHQGAIVVHDRAEIGDECVIRQGVTLGASSHRRAWEAPKLGKRVQVGAGAMILGDINIGDGVAIGANVVVTCDVPPMAKVLSAPARIVPDKAA
jgi:serine O-acetyltransferase